MDFPDTTVTNLADVAEKKRIWHIFAGIIVILLSLYTVIWYLLSAHLQQWVEECIAKSSLQGINLYCKSLHKTGFPLRIGSACDTINYQWPIAGVAFSSSGLVASSPIFAPQWRLIQVVSPASFEVPGLIPIGANWEKLQINSEFEHGSLSDVEIRINQLDTFNLNDNRQKIDLIKADFIHLVSRIKTKVMRLDVTYDQLLLPYFVTSSNTQMPALGGKAIVTLNDPGHLLLPIVGPWSNRLRSMTGQIESASIIFEGGGQLILSGDFSFSDDGYLNGKFQVAFVNSYDLRHVLRQLYPSKSSNIGSFFFALNSLPKDKKGNPIVNFNVDHGNVSALVFNVGKIPPV